MSGMKEWRTVLEESKGNILEQCIESKYNERAMACMVVYFMSIKLFYPEKRKWGGES